MASPMHMDKPTDLFTGPNH